MCKKQIIETIRQRRTVQEKIVRTPSILSCVENALTHVPHKPQKFYAPYPGTKDLYQEIREIFT